MVELGWQFYVFNLLCVFAQCLDPGLEFSAKDVKADEDWQKHCDDTPIFNVNIVIMSYENINNPYKSILDLYVSLG